MYREPTEEEKKILDTLEAHLIDKNSEYSSLHKALRKFIRDAVKEDEEHWKSIVARF